MNSIDRNSVDIMMREHQNILRMVKVIRNMCYEVYTDKKMEEQDFLDIVDFVKNYADKHHHGKEEEIMFQSMVDHLGKIGENLITHGMLVEHDYGRLYMRDLQEALAAYQAGDEKRIIDIIASAISYTHMIERHIKKEDELVYPYGSKHMPEDVMHEVDEKTVQFEKDAAADGIQEHYLQMIERLEKKYHVNE